MKKAYLSVDIEEWYHLDYLKNYEVDKSATPTIPEMTKFLDMLDELNIKATFFTLAEIASEYKDLLIDIKRRGHEIGCHGFDHELLYNKSDDEFRIQVSKAKRVLDEIVGENEVIGYRASCFSMDRKKLDILKEIGYLYDSSYISFAHHPLYGSLNLDGYEKIDDSIYKLDNFLEYEIPTYQIGKYNIPISGGGYLRLFPTRLSKLFINSYMKENNNFVLYIHPYELTNIQINYPEELSSKYKFRAEVGRKNNLIKLKEVLIYLMSKGIQFNTFKEDYNSRMAVANYE